MSEPRHVTNLRHDCETHGCYRAELWDWTPYNECFGDSGIRISDIDGMVERNGLFLMLDGKREGSYLSKGQLTMYKRFAETKAGTCIVFHGLPPLTVQKARIWRPGGELEGPFTCDLDGLKQIVADWYVWANGMRRTEEEVRLADPEMTDDWPEVRYPPDHPKYRPEVA